MVVTTLTTVRLDPVKDAEVMRQYENDKGWEKIVSTRTAVAYRHMWPTYNVGAAYISTKGGRE